MSNHLRSHWSQVSKIVSDRLGSRWGHWRGHWKWRPSPAQKHDCQRLWPLGSAWNLNSWNDFSAKRHWRHDADENTDFVCRLSGCLLRLPGSSSWSVGFSWPVVGRIVGWLNLAIKLKYIVTCWVSFILRNACERVRQVTFGRFGPLYEWCATLIVTISCMVTSVPVWRNFVLHPVVCPDFIHQCEEERAGRNSCRSTPWMAVRWRPRS